MAFVEKSFYPPTQDPSCPLEGKDFRPVICPNNIKRPEAREFASSSICQSCPRDPMAGNTIFSEIIFSHQQAIMQE